MNRTEIQVSIVVHNITSRHNKLLITKLIKHTIKQSLKLNYTNRSRSVKKQLKNKLSFIEHNVDMTRAGRASRPHPQPNGKHFAVISR